MPTVNTPSRNHLKWKLGGIHTKKAAHCRCGPVAHVNLCEVAGNRHV